MNQRIITRERYKEVRKYDRQEMEQFLGDIYMQGKQDGLREGIAYQKALQDQTSSKEEEWFTKGVGATKNMLTTVMHQALDETKGIGVKTKTLFISNFNQIATKYCEKIVGVVPDEPSKSNN